ncbi:MAG: 16S rRNA (adenine(1518)-N(6)/adenine(1519)-N(6))-dimethyltransferase RsmA [Acidobacteriia bacterium]|nr:16S rRNA (adenine(1518)-N(6)/adenine(1519)-N(6))-dimethyltransferase RsmA [Terriglobia bacterium]
MPARCRRYSRRLRYNLAVPRTRRPKLGQHFLASAAYRRRIAEALHLRADDLVIEIGAGRGAMTELLAARAGRVIAVELDPVLAASLREKLKATPQIEILQADILTTDLAALCREHEAEKCFVFGNLPYYITSPILHRLFAFAPWIRAMALLVQREVAGRLTALTGRRAYGYLSVRTQLYSRPRVVLGVPPGAFSPPPKIHSALVDFQMIPQLPEWVREREVSPIPARQAAHPREIAFDPAARFLDFVKCCFAQKRKNLLNNLAGIYSRERVEQALAALGLPPNTRAEQLALSQFAGLFERLS